MKKQLSLAVAIATIGLLVGCGADDQPKPKKEDATKATETTPTAGQKEAVSAVDESNLPVHRIATMSTYPPFATKDENGVLTGFDIDVLKAIAKNRKFKAEFVAHPWEDWKKDLTKGDIEVWTAGIGIKEDRKEFVDFSDPYMSDNTAMLTIDKNISEENMGEHTIGVEAKSIAVGIAKSLTQDASKIKEFPSNYTAFEALIQGKVDSIIGNEVVLANMTTPFAKDFSFNLQPLKISKEANKKLGFMVKKGDTEMATELNEGLKAIQESGEYDKIKQKWFGDLVE